MSINVVYLSNLSRYGQPDPDLNREFDFSVRLRMSSVRYVHTNRFQSEVVAFLQHFNQLQDVLSRMRAAAAGQKVKCLIDNQTSSGYASL